MKKRIHLQLEILEARDCPSTGYWNPIYTEPNTQIYAWTGEGTRYGVTYTNWTKGPTPTGPGGFGNRIPDINNGTTISGFPGEYGTNGSSSDVATLGGTGASNIDCTEKGVPNTLQAFDIISPYTATITLQSPLTVYGGGGPGHFSMVSPATININCGDNSTPGLLIYNSQGTSDWDTGTIMAGSAYSGYGGFNITGGTYTTAMQIGSVAGQPAPTLEANMNISGSNLATPGEVVMTNMAGNLTLGYSNTIYVNDDGLFANTQVNTNNANLQGGINTPSGNSLSVYAVVVRAGGTFQRGTAACNASDSVGINRPFENFGGEVDIFANSALYLLGTNGEFDQFNAGSTTTVYYDYNAGTKSCGFLSANTWIDLNAGMLTLQAGADPNGKPSNELSSHLLDVKNTAILKVSGADNGNEATMGVQISGPLVFENGSFYEPYDWGKTLDVCQLFDSNASITINSSAICQLLTQDATQIPKGGILKAPIMSITDGTHKISAAFTTNRDTVGDNNLKADVTTINDVSVYLLTN